MPLMHSPDGAETMDVPDADVARLQAMGATLADASKPQSMGEQAGNAALGAVAAGGDALQGLKSIGVPLLAGGGALLAKGAIDRLRRPSAAPQAAQAAPAAPRPSAAPSGKMMVTADDIAMHPEFRSIPEGTYIPNRDYMKVKIPENYAPAGSRPSAAKPASTSVSMSTAQEIPTVPNSVTVTKGRPSRLKLVEGSAKAKATGDPTPSPSEVPVRTRPSAVKTEPTPMDAPNVTDPAFRAKTGAPVHEVQYYSESRGKFEPIESMHVSHLRNAMNKLFGKLNNKPNPITQKQFDAIANEVKYRAGQAGELTVPGPVGKAQTAAAAEFEDQALARAAGGGMRGLGGTMLGVAGYLPNLMNPGQDMRAADQQRAAQQVQHLIDLGMNPEDAHRTIYAQTGS